MTMAPMTNTETDDNNREQLEDLKRAFNEYPQNDEENKHEKFPYIHKINIKKNG